MKRIFRRILWAAALLLLVACSAKKEAVAPLLPYPLLPLLPPPCLAAARPGRGRPAADDREPGFRGRQVPHGRGRPRPISNATEIYLIDESTGEKFPVVRLQRIGRHGGVQRARGRGRPSRHVPEPRRQAEGRETGHDRRRDHARQEHLRSGVTAGEPRASRRDPPGVSRAFRESVVGVIGFWRKARPLPIRPRCFLASSAYPDM